jgi:hypothetical protein
VLEGVAVGVGESDPVPHGEGVAVWEGEPVPERVRELV